MSHVTLPLRQVCLHLAHLGRGYDKYKTMFASSETSANLTTNAEELNQYLYETMINPACDPAGVGRYWSKNPYTWLKTLRLKYLCVPPVTVFRELLLQCRMYKGL